MNKQIQKLVEQADKYAWAKVANKYDNYDGLLNSEWEDAKMEKFAELIVKECADIALAEAQSNGNFDTFNKIVKHFGVEL